MTSARQAAHANAIGDYNAGADSIIVEAIIIDAIGALSRRASIEITLAASIHSYNSASPISFA